jgi:hypothetical protein
LLRFYTGRAFPSTSIWDWPPIFVSYAAGRHRGKAGANGEFGSGLFIAENQAGFNIDHEMSKKAAQTDGKTV